MVHKANESTVLYEGGGANIHSFQQPVEEEQQPKPEAKERVYYADWIRAMAIFLVIFVHCLVNSFDASGLDPTDVPTI